MCLLEGKGHSPCPRFPGRARQEISLWKVLHSCKCARAYRTAEVHEELGVQLWGCFSLGRGKVAMNRKSPALSQEMHEVWSGDMGLLHSGGGERSVGRPTEKAWSQPALAVGAPGLRISVDARVPLWAGWGWVGARYWQS